ncbi:hypothetical protein KUCAC02_016269 [Chaenocephalus aceratus]|uniref:Uncharacterized protein n=1 Tax=Chaenocephalus aceratus TaxID=36190 RepID=A0ACB9XZU7_CHAAC|nr:hypothetical protein KUCAC02_016269 [Chaenocephalus aceratus]
MAAFRRVAALAGKLNLWTAARTELFGGQTASGGRTRKSLAVGMCLATGGAVAAYFYNDTWSGRGRKRMGSHENNGLLPSIPTVIAKEKVGGRYFVRKQQALETRRQETLFQISLNLYTTLMHVRLICLYSQHVRLTLRKETCTCRPMSIASACSALWSTMGSFTMTPQNFIESVTMSEPKNKRPWRSLAKTEYLFLLCILTTHAGFKIAFNMFDADGNQMVDKREFLVLQEIFRKKNEKRGRKGDAEKSAQLVLKKDSQEFVARSYWDVLRRGASQVLFSDLAERADESSTIDTTLLVHFFGKKGKAELTFDDFYRFMDNLQTEMLEIEFLTYSKGMTTISEEDFAKILLRFTNVENISAYLENVRHCIPDEKFLNNLEDFAIAMQMYNFASRSIGQDEFARAVYVATGLKADTSPRTHHLQDL